MKKNLAALATMMVAAAVMMLATAVPTFAQHSGPMKVNVPFNFAVENERLTAGEYTIQRVANGRLMIRSNDDRVHATFIVIPTQGKSAPEQAHFIFRHYGNDYFLATIWTPGQDVGWEVLQGKLEMELAKKATTPVQTALLIGH